MKNSKKTLLVAVAIAIVALTAVVTATAASKHSQAHHRQTVSTKKKATSSTSAKSVTTSSSMPSSSSVQASATQSTVSNSQVKTATPVSTPTPATNEVPSGTQLVNANPNVYGEPGMCLGYVDGAFGVTARGGQLSYSATAAAGKATAAGAMHNNDQFPAGKMVPVFWNLTSKDDGVNYGHVAIWDGQGGFYWEGNHSSTPNHLTYAELTAVLNGQQPINGKLVTDSFTGASLIGWSDNLEGVQILSK